MANMNNNDVITLFSSSQKTEEGYTSMDNHRYYLTAMMIEVNERMAKQLSLLGLIVQFRPFNNLQENVGGGFPYQRRINTRLPQRSGSSMTRTNYAGFERPSEYKKETTWLSEALNKSLYEMSLNNTNVDAEFEAEFTRLFASFVSGLFQDCITELALSTQKQHIPAYPTDLVALWMVEHVRNINRFAGRGEVPSDALRDLINLITPEISLNGIVLFGNEHVLSNFNLKTKTVYEDALQQLVNKMTTDQIINFNYGFLESGKFMMTSRFPMALKDNIPIKKFLSYMVISPLAIIPQSEFAAGTVLIPGARGHGFYEVKSKGGDYTAVRLHEVCIRGETLIGTVLATNEYQKPIMAYINTIQEHGNAYAQAGSQELVLRQPICVGVAGHESIRTCPAAVVEGCEYPRSAPHPFWQSTVASALKATSFSLSEEDMVELKSSSYFADHVYLKHSFDHVGTLSDKLFGTDDRFSSLTDNTIKNEYAYKQLDDVPAGLIFKSSSFALTQVPYIVKKSDGYTVQPVNHSLLSVLAGQPTSSVSEIFTPTFQFTPVALTL